MYLLAVCFLLLSNMTKSMINATIKIIDVTNIAVQIPRRLNLFLHMIKVLANVIKLTLISSSSDFVFSNSQYDLPMYRVILVNAWNLSRFSMKQQLFDHLSVEFMINIKDS